VVPFPVPKAHGEKVTICYYCLRDGLGSITQDTEFGMVTWEYAIQGHTHGVPGLKTVEYEIVPIEPDDDWYGIKLPREHLFELIRTPRFFTWQGARWLFCCKRPMAYLGEWPSVKKTALAQPDPYQFLDHVLKDDENKEIAIDCAENGTGSVYFFQCRSCTGIRVNWDND
jgi:uncharacterized protein CbrC (UPF0167 family)